MVAASLQEIIDPGSGGSGGAASPGKPGAGGAPSAVGDAVAAATPGERAAAAEQARGVKQAVDKLTGTIEKLDELVAKISEGKSVAGRLLVDERLGRKLGSAAEDVADQLDRVFKLQLQVQLRSEWLLNQTGAKTYFGVRLLPRPDKYYLLEVVSDPRGVDSVSAETITTRDPITGLDSTRVSTRTLHEDKLTFTLQIAKRYGPMTFRAGVIESSGGIGTDLHLFRDKLQFSVSVYQFSRPYQDVFPRAKVWMNYYFLQHFFVIGGRGRLPEQLALRPLPGWPEVHDRQRRLLRRRALLHRRRPEDAPRRGRGQRGPERELARYSVETAYVAQSLPPRPSRTIVQSVNPPGGRMKSTSPPVAFPTPPSSGNSPSVTYHCHSRLSNGVVYEPSGSHTVNFCTDPDCALPQTTVLPAGNGLVVIEGPPSQASAFAGARRTSATAGLVFRS